MYFTIIKLSLEFVIIIQNQCKFIIDMSVTKALYERIMKVLGFKN